MAGLGAESRSPVMCLIKIRCPTLYTFPKLKLNFEKFLCCFKGKFETVVTLRKEDEEEMPNIC